MTKLIFQNFSHNNEFDCLITFKVVDNERPLARTERLGKNATWPIDLDQKHEIESISLISDGQFTLISSIQFEDKLIKTYVYTSWMDLSVPGLMSPDLTIIAIEILDAETSLSINRKTQSRQ
jgi:hypothetical protein